MRHICLGLMLLFLPTAVTAQHARPAEPPSSALGPIGLPLPSIGLPLPPIGLTIPPAGLTMPPIGLTQPPKDAPPPTRDQRPHAPPRQHRQWRSSVVYVVSPYGYGWWSEPLSDAPPTTASGVTVFAPEPPNGRLRLEVEPAGLLQVFVDGAYFGTPEDLGKEIELSPGTRRIEIRAPGYQTLIFDARIEAQRTITYRGALDRSGDAPGTPSAPRDRDLPTETPKPDVPAGSQKLYVIPGCYLGNVPPEELKLPAGCDLRNLKTFMP